jgi:hypothetical protein
MAPAFGQRPLMALGNAIVLGRIKGNERSVP